jgi:eukaryotic-like serine/threonine-protein kinase
MAPQGPDNRRQFGKYRLVAHLATGGMAEIFLASQSSLAGFEKLLVIKRILPNLAREARFVEMFLDEARIAAMLNHPNVVQIFDLGRVQGQFFIAMEYLSGESLSMLIRKYRGRKTAIPPHLAAGILLQAAEGLHHAHHMVGKDGKPLNIVHRDVSPQNIFVLYDGGVKVVDFGIAKAALRSTQTRAGTLKGKYAYMSPEQVLGEELDGRSDVFALGIVLWECLVGAKLFKQESELKLLQSITQKDAPSPRSVNPGVPEALAAITLKAMARNREERFSSAAEFRSALAAYLKTCQLDADTVAIGAVMQDMFSDRIRQKRDLIESAQASDAELEDILFDDLGDYLSDTEYSVPRSPISSSSSREVNTIRRMMRRRNKRRPMWIGLILVLLAGAGSLAAWLATRGKGDEPSAEPVDGGGALVQPVDRPDAGETPDAGAEEPADPGQAIVAPAADPGPPDAGKTIPRRKRKRRRRVAQKRDGGARPAPSKVPDGPPGKLRLMTNPWTDIYFQGRKLGQTPLVDVVLPSGKLKLRAINPEAGIDKVIWVEIKPDQRVTKRFNFF